MAQSKICPFMSSHEKPVFCSPNCQLFRNREGYECSFQEIASISWNTKKSGGGAHASAPPPGY